MYHVSCIMYHVSCIMYHVSCIMHHASCIMHHASCIMHHASWIMDHVSCIMYHVSCIMHHVSCIMHHASCIMHHVSCIMYHVSQLVFLGYDVVWYRICGFHFQRRVCMLYVRFIFHQSGTVPDPFTLSSTGLYRKHSTCTLTNQVHWYRICARAQSPYGQA